MTSSSEIKSNLSIIFRELLPHIKRKAVVKPAKPPASGKPLASSLVVTTDEVGRVVETIHVITKPGVKAQTKVASSLNQAVYLADQLNDEVSFNDVSSNVSDLTSDFHVEPAPEAAGKEDRLDGAQESVGQ